MKHEKYFLKIIDFPDIRTSSSDIIKSSCFCIVGRHTWKIFLEPKAVPSVQNFRVSPPGVTIRNGKKHFQANRMTTQKSYSHFKIWIQNFTKTKNLICDMYYDVEYASQNYRNPKNIESVICFQLLKYCYDWYTK